MPPLTGAAGVPGRADLALRARQAEPSLAAASGYSAHSIRPRDPPRTQVLCLPAQARLLNFYRADARSPSRKPTILAAHRLHCRCAPVPAISAYLADVPDARVAAARITTQTGRVPAAAPNTDISLDPRWELPGEQALPPAVRAMPAARQSFHATTQRWSASRWSIAGMARPKALGKAAVT
jgi:hypothetical protein